MFLPNRSLLNGSAGLVIKRGATVDNNEERDKKSSLEVLGDLFINIIEWLINVEILISVDMGLLRRFNCLFNCLVYILMGKGHM